MLDLAIQIGSSHSPDTVRAFDYEFWLSFGLDFKGYKSLNRAASILQDLNRAASILQEEEEDEIKTVYACNASRWP